MTGAAGRVLGAAAAAVFAVLAVAYRYDPVAAWDLEVAGWVATTVPGWGEWAARPFSWLGNWAVMTVLAVGATLAFVRLARQEAAVAVAVAGLASLVVTQAVKAGFDRPRPEIDPALPLPSTAAFPSGHASSAAAVFLVVATLVGRRALVATAVALAFAVGGSRIVLGVHWLSDVVAGWALGLACVWVAHEVAGAVSRRRGRRARAGDRATTPSS